MGWLLLLWKMFGAGAAAPGELCGDVAMRPRLRGETLGQATLEGEVVMRPRLRGETEAACP